jgi:hypothetical protein
MPPESGRSQSATPSTTNAARDMVKAESLPMRVKCGDEGMRA